MKDSPMRIIHNQATTPKRKTTSLLVLSMALFTSMYVNLHGMEPEHLSPEAIEEAHKKGVAYKDEIERDPETWQWNIPIKMPFVTHGVVRSKSMDRDVGYNIYLPPSYEESTKTRFPVVYYCHGATGSETSDIRAAGHLISEIKSGNIGEVIYVFMNAGHYSGYRDRPEDNVMAETYITQELIPAIDERYRTIATRKGRALMGFSMGGGGATRLALKYPDLFCAIVSFGGAIDRDPDAPVEDDDRRRRYSGDDNAYRWATENRDKIKEDFGLFFLVGGEDFLYPRHPPFLAHLTELEIPFDYRVKSGLGHSIWGLMELFGAETMRFLDSHYAKPQETE